VVLRTVEAALALAAWRPGGRDGSGAGGGPGGPKAGERQPEVIPDLKIPVRPVPLTLWTVDGATLSGQIFLRLTVGTHAGPETVQDRLNDSDVFVTLSVPGETSVIFLNKIQVIRVDAPEEEEERPPEAAERLAGVSMESIRVQLINGEQLSGAVRIEGPAGRRRLSDFLNKQPPFLALRGSDRLHLLHKRFIARIVLQGA
jgi:hypothetical protein